MMDAQTAISEKLDTALNELTGVRGKFEALDMAVQHTFDRVEIVAAGALPSITNHIAQISRAQTVRQHRRKWPLVINGVAGAANEREDTRAAVLAWVERLSRYPTPTPQE